MEQRLMAFWHYDEFPYVLWGEIIKFENNGTVSVKGYDNYYFRPILILPFDEGGFELSSSLKDLKSKRTIEISKIENSYMEQVKDKMLSYDSSLVWSRI